MDALAWIGQLVEWIGKFIPRWNLVDLTSGAVKTEMFFLPSKLRRFKEETRLTVLGPGLHWYWPATTEFIVHPTVVQTDNLPSQTIETADGVTITIGGMITYQVSDLGKLIPRCYSSYKLVQVITLAAIHGAICKLTWSELREAQRKGTLNTRLRNATQKELAEFGVEVKECMLTDLVRSRAYRLIQSTQSDTE